MNHIGLFEGIGGFSLAARWINWNTIAWCEINPFCQKILKKHFPDAIGHHDITTTDFTIYRGRIDVITGGFPCQPFSISNQQKRDDDTRKLWPEMLRAIREIRPTWIVGENVPNIKNMAIDSIISDLEACQYSTEVFIIPAIAAGAIHRRDRIWIVAHSNSKRLEKYRNERQQTAQNASQSFLWPTESPICGANDGLSYWVDRIKSLGNAIVPQVAFEIFKAIEHEELKAETIK